MAGMVEGRGNSAIIKKGEGDEYRGIPLMSSVYKVYAYRDIRCMILAGRLKEEMERGGILPPNQTGFREGMGTIDSIYVLNCLANRKLRKKEMLVALLVDLKAALTV